mgnify:CR=1 FL=1
MKLINLLNWVRESDKLKGKLPKIIDQTWADVHMTINNGLEKQRIYQNCHAIQNSIASTLANGGNGSYVGPINEKSSNDS